MDQESVYAFELEHPHIAGPDVGTAAALATAALSLQRLRSLVAGAGGAAVPDASHVNSEDADDEYAAHVTAWRDTHAT